MRVWIDILTPKQALFFEPLIDALKERGDEVVVTSRRYREAELICRKRQIDAVFIGRELLRNPYFPLQAQIELDKEKDLPNQYERAF